MNDDKIRTEAIAANLEALERLLKEAACRGGEGRDKFQQGQRNGAIGGIIGLEDILADAAALYRVIMLLHRRRQS